MCVAFFFFCGSIPVKHVVFLKSRGSDCSLGFEQFLVKVSSFWTSAGVSFSGTSVKPRRFLVVLHIGPRPSSFSGPVLLCLLKGKILEKKLKKLNL